MKRCDFCLQEHLDAHIRQVSRKGERLNQCELCETQERALKRLEEEEGISMFRIFMVEATNLDSPKAGMEAAVGAFDLGRILQQEINANLGLKTFLGYVVSPDNDRPYLIYGTGPRALEKAEFQALGQWFEEIMVQSNTGDDDEANDRRDNLETKGEGFTQEALAGILEAAENSRFWLIYC